MILTNKLLPIALIAALVGGSVGAFVMHKSQPSAAETVAQSNTLPATQASDTEALPAQFNTPAEQTAYKTGFADGYDAASPNASAPVSTSRSRVSSPARRVASRNTGSQRVYYNYSQPQKRSFWDKHRDKLTVAMGTGAGAAIGGLIGGKKGAAIGALSGAGGSALYTYKLRKRTPRNY